MPLKSISPKRLAANRANAARSTGPRTPEGKARSSRNARKHTFNGANFAIVRLEELDSVARLRADLIAAYAPVNSQELFAVERIALAQQALLRASTLETGLFTSCLDMTFRDVHFVDRALTEELTRDIEVTRAQNRAFALAEGLQMLFRCSNAFPFYLRYQAQAERLYRRAVEEFERLRALRDVLPNEPILEPEPLAPPPLTPPETNPPAGSAEPAAK